MRHEIKGGPLKVGVEIEDYVSSVLDSHGIKHKMMEHHSHYDILLDNGLRVDVKSSNENRQKSTFYNFATSRKKRGLYADFFVCVSIETKDIFVIPVNETRDTGTPIRFKWPVGQKKSKWHKYHNRIDLLKP